MVKEMMEGRGNRSFSVIHLMYKYENKFIEQAERTTV
jgi:hypothetical protein